LAEKGIYAASKSLGHASITTTQRYAITNDEELVEIQDVYPLKKSA
jgi:site-specific recombinase XerD